MTQNHYDLPLPFSLFSHHPTFPLSYVLFPFSSLTLSSSSPFIPTFVCSSPSLLVTSSILFSSVGCRCPFVGGIHALPSALSCIVNQSPFLPARRSACAVFAVVRYLSVCLSAAFVSKQLNLSLKF